MSEEIKEKLTGITSNINFCRVFEIPKNYPKGFCFGGGQHVMLKMVDWFNPIPIDDIIYPDKLKSWGEYVPMLKEFLMQKNYIKKGQRYVLVTDFGESLSFVGE